MMQLSTVWFRNNAMMRWTIEGFAIKVNGEHEWRFVSIDEALNYLGISADINKDY